MESDGNMTYFMAFAKAGLKQEYILTLIRSHQFVFLVV